MFRTFLFLISIILAGCGATPLTYNSQDSYALNIARAANINAKLKDTEVPKDTVSSITDSSGYGFAMAASGYSAPLPGLSQFQMAGLNFTSWLLSPTAKSARNSMIVWMPQKAANGSPKEALADLLLQASSKAIRDLGYIPVEEIAKGGTDKTGIAVYVTGRNDNICQDNQYGKSNCWISFAIRDAKLDAPPSLLESNQDKAWYFDPSDNIYSRFVFPKAHQGLNELELLLKTSEYLPSWIYFYVAPSKLFIAEEKKIKVPLIIQSGKIHYFIKPQKVSN